MYVLVYQGPGVEASVPHDPLDALLDVPNLAVGLDVVIPQPDRESGHVPRAHAA